MTVVIKPNAYEILGEELAECTNEDWNETTIAFHFFLSGFQDARQCLKLLKNFVGNTWEFWRRLGKQTHSSVLERNGKNNICLKSRRANFDITGYMAFLDVEIFANYPESVKLHFSRHAHQESALYTSCQGNFMHTKTWTQLFLLDGQMNA